MGIHVIIGTDDFLVGATAKKLIGDGVGLEVVDSANASNAELQLADIRETDASFSTPPFLDPVKVTWWKNVHFLPGGGGKREVAEDVKAALEKFAAKIAAAKPPDNQTLIISGPHLLKTSVFAKTLSGVAEMAVFSAGKPWEEAKGAVVRAIDFAADRGLKFESGAAEAFVARVGTDTRSILSELGKLQDYLGKDARVISAAAIDEVTSPGAGVEPEVWAITDALGARDLAGCLAATRRFEGESGFAVLVTTVVEKFFRQMLDVARGKTDGLNPYAVRKMGVFLRKWTERELRVARWRFLTLREKSVSSAGSTDDLVFTELVRVCRRR